MGDIREIVLITTVVFVVVGSLIQLALSDPISQCEIQDGKCTYNINLAPSGSCQSTLLPPDKETFIRFEKIPESLNYVNDEKMSQMQQDFNTVKSDHENRIKELESSIQKVLRNSIPTVPIGYQDHRTGYDTIPLERTRHVENNGVKEVESGDNLLIFRLQSQFNRMRTSLSQKTADLVEVGNKLNETTDLLTAAQRQALDSSTKLVEFETKATVLDRETNILKNKLKDKTERLKYATERLNTSETKLINVENRLYDVVRSEATIKEELETLKIVLNKTQTELNALREAHEDLQTKYKKTRNTLARREEELMECYSAKTATFCGFEDPELCGFTQVNGTDDFDWGVVQGSTPSSRTGPENDHTCKSSHGHYLYIEASGRSKGNIARLKSPKYRGLEPQCVEFFYHMYGRQTGTLTVYSKLLTSDELIAVWRVFGNQGNLWIKASISVSEETARSGYQLILEGITELGYEGDISIDDFRIRDGICAADAASLEPTRSPLTDNDRSTILRDQIERYRKILKRRQRMRQKSQEVS
ncbi:uncharacterized protein LOC128212190 isoform X3 [Mya arenaria]|uniref:uncharacterized protein LOC128212190 isoform X3 n=1 Tax=Mya arenaria TaxID=6604 RepID=UPI0022E96986|nr:uncharacterized protein LOC128212190 isoform X3 [Mya arenaria]